MSKYIDADKLKAEIERRKCNAELDKIEAEGVSSLNYNIHLAEENLCLKLLFFLDTIQEQPVECLEEAAMEYAEKHGFRVPYDGSNNFYDDVDVKASKEGFIAGAEWQKNQMLNT